MREEQAHRMRRLERRVAKVETGQDAQDPSKIRETVEAASWRPYRDVVPGESEPSEERLRELEIELIEDLKLTLPPSKYP